MTTKRPYYSKRTGKRQRDYELDLSALRKMFLTVYGKLEDEGYFQEYFGYYCVDQDFVPGKLGTHIGGIFLLTFRRDNLWPIMKHIETYSEDDLFDVIEFLYDHVSKPIRRQSDYHSYSDCGWHFSRFEQHPGQLEFRQQINEILVDYQGGWLISETGEILSSPERGMESLLSAPLPSREPDIISRVAAAVNRFRRHKSSYEDRRHALADLAGVLEYLRPQIKTVLLRRTNPSSLTLPTISEFGTIINYRKRITIRPYRYSWMFYYYLATIHASVRLMREESSCIRSTFAAK